MPPLPDEVFITWPSSPSSSMRGTKALIPWMTPHRFTARPQSQSLIVWSQILPFGAGADAGVVAQHVDGAVGGVRLVAQLLDRREVGDVGDDAGHLVARGAQSGDRLLERVGEDVGEHDAHALGHGEALTERLADAAGATGDHGDAAVEVLHASRAFIAMRADAKAGTAHHLGGDVPGAQRFGDLGRGGAELGGERRQCIEVEAVHAQPRCRRPWRGLRPRARPTKASRRWRREYGQHPSRWGKSLPHMIRSTPTV